MRTMVVSAKNGSIVAVTGSGIRHMSDSLIAFQPAIEDPSNIRPSANVSSSIMPTSKVTCCHLPRGSVKRRSTYFTSLSLIDLRTSLAVFMNSPYLLRSVSWSERRARWRTKSGCRKQPVFLVFAAKFPIANSLDSVQPGFAGPDADRFLDIGNEDFAVADATCLGSSADGVDRLLHQIVADHDLDFDLGQEVDDVFRTAIQFRVALLPSKALGLGDGDALQSDFLKRLLHLVEFERLDDGLDLLH